MHHMPMHAWPCNIDDEVYKVKTKTNSFYFLAVKIRLCNRLDQLDQTVRPLLCLSLCSIPHACLE